MSSTSEQVSNRVSTPFTYSSLPLEPNTTRMIRLLPNRDKSAPIQCELFNYNISRLGEEHLYEALSYVWGSPDRSRSIILDGCRFLITESLHTALLRLRDRQLERILWVDAISIKQDNDNDNDNEKSKQIPLMPMIYAQARRVLVWLGEAQEYGDKALEILGNLGRKQISMPIEEKDREKCEKLLQRDWFRRIWVLQEVGLAQYVTIMCGSVQINGQVFCEGLENMKPSPALMAGISPVSFLIRGAPFRSHDEHHSTATLSIGELVSMYRNHKATVQHDKIYALLGLSTNSAALIPNYQLAWHEVFKQLVENVFPECSVETWCGCDLAIIKGKGWVWGYVYSVSDFMESSQQTFKILCNQNCRQLGYQNNWETEWSLQASGELVQDGDIICLLEGLSEPSILRLCADYYAVVTPVVKPKKQVQKEEDDVMVSESCPMHGLCDILLVWKLSQLEDKADLQSLSSAIENTPQYHSEVEQRLNHTTFLMVDAAMEITKLGIFGKRALENILFQRRIKDLDAECLIQNRRVSRNFESAVKQALWQPSELFDVWKEVLEVSARKPEPCDNRVLMIIIRCLTEKLPVSEGVIKTLAVSSTEHGYEILQQLLEHCGDRLPVSEQVIKVAASNRWQGGQILQQLLKRYGDRLPVSEEVVQVAAANESQGDQIMQQLLGHYGNKLPVSEEIVKITAANEEQGDQILQQLLKHHGDKLPVPEEVVMILAASSTGYKYGILQQLLELHGNKLPVSEEVVKVAAANEHQGDQIMQQLLKQYGDRLPVPEKIAKIAAVNREQGDQIMQQLLKHHGDKLPVSEEVVKEAAANESQGDQIMQRLLKYYGNKLSVSEEVVKVAAANEHQGDQIMRQLLKHHRDKLPVSEEIVKTAAANKFQGDQILQQLLEWYGTRLAVSGEIVQEAAGNEYQGDQIMQQLLKHYGDRLPVPEEVVMMLAASSTGYKYGILQQLLKHCGERLPVTEEVVKIAAANEYQGGQIMQQLLKRYRDRLPVSEEVVQVAAANESQGDQIMQQLLGHYGNKLPVSEEIVKITAANEEQGDQILQQLLKCYGDRLAVCEEVVQVAAANELQGDWITQRLLKHYGDRLPVSEEVVKVAAANGAQGYRIMQRFLKYHGDRLPVSEEVVKVAASNRWRGGQILQQLLERYGDRLPVSEEVVQVATANESQGDQIMQQLLEHYGDRHRFLERWIRQQQ
ncbi:HET-domain-containing protein [Aspergillus phoenicis ATCC 13157]|uniref:HET-domain-containing protein n=1 Tax=Aspergillus phoenicis ATCC 13157 TaxID=1353007 RepID=A0A370P8J3_ASPPH|nr:HET-domain-containing protein [Aspergillus phoenicis ATCC 13157]